MRECIAPRASRITDTRPHPRISAFLHGARRQDICRSLRRRIPAGHALSTTTTTIAGAPSLHPRCPASRFHRRPTVTFAAKLAGLSRLAPCPHIPTATGIPPCRSAHLRWMRPSHTRPSPQWCPSRPVRSPILPVVPTSSIRSLTLAQLISNKTARHHTISNY
jgi:hypothetical protein